MVTRLYSYAFATVALGAAVIIVFYSVKGTARYRDGDVLDNDTGGGSQPSSLQRLAHVRTRDQHAAPTHITRSSLVKPEHVVTTNTAGSLAFTLFISLAPPSRHLTTHYAEIIAAVRANLLGNAFEKIVIWYEATQNNTCALLLEELDLQGHGGIAVEVAQRTECWPRLGGQPTYGDMFRAVQDNRHRLKTGAVLISNADVVFGSTLQTILPIEPGILHTLTVNGVPSDVPALYCAATRQNPGGCSVCHVNKPTPMQPNSCFIVNGTRTHAVVSWDAYALNLTSFTRLNIDQTKLGFHMNVDHAENRALCELIKQGWNATNDCHRIRAVHFHCGPKTHNTAGRNAIIPGNRALRACNAGLFVGPFDGADFYRRPEYARVSQPEWLGDEVARAIL